MVSRLVAVVAAAVGLLPAETAAAQSLEARFLSEFRRVGADGEIVAADAAGTPREIISPAIVRNGYTSFRIVVKGPPGQPYRLFIALNPEGLLRPVLFRASPGVGAGSGALEPLPKPLEAEGKFNERGAGQYWLDVWTPASTPIRRIRLEAQLSYGGDWVITPLELRVMAATVPEKPPVLAPAHVLYRHYLCGGVLPAPPAPRPTGGSLAAKLQRNASQDLLIARKLEAAAPPPQGRAAVEAVLLRAFEAPSVEAWCAATASAPPADPEAFLRARDALWRADR